MSPRRWFDAHLDLACLSQVGRDMHAPIGSCGGPPDPAVTLGSLTEGGVQACLATVFTEPGGTDEAGYPAGDSQAAYTVGSGQLEIYSNWSQRGLCVLDLGREIGSAPGTRASASGCETPGRQVLRMGILVEGADPIRTPGELPWWIARGVVAVGMAWARSSRYAAGNMSPERGLTDLGREMIRVMDDLGVVHDVSHLSDLAMDELFDRARGRVIASHSNCRSLLGGQNQRHLRDDSIRAIADRGGMIGLNLYGRFLVPEGMERESTVDDVADHADHVASIAQSRRRVGLGSDMDGGFGASALPAGIRRPTDLCRLAESLSARGWSDADIEGFAWANWAGFWNIP